MRESLQSRRASFYHGAKIRNSAVLPLAGNLLGSAFPKPCYAACAAYPRRAHAARKEVTTMRKKYNTPHRSRVVKTRLSEDEYADFTARLAPYGISQSEFLRQAIRRTTIRPVIHVSAVNDELLSAVGKLAAEYGRIGGNLNQIARYLNEYGAPYNALSGEVRAAIADLAALKYEVLQKVGDAVGNTQAYVKWSIADLPILPQKWQYLVSASTKKQFGILQKLMNRPDVDSIVNSCDAGQCGWVT